MNSARGSRIRTVLLTTAVVAASMLLTGHLPAQEQESGARNVPTRNTLRTTFAVATRALQRGDTIRAGDFRLVDTTIVWRWSMPSSDTASVQPGWVAQRAIAAGEALRTPSVQPPLVIAGGAQVKAIYRDGPIEIEMIGTAINGAALNAPVSIRVARTRRLEGIAIAPNTVRLK